MSQNQRRRLWRLNADGRTGGKPREKYYKRVIPKEKVVGKRKIKKGQLMFVQSKGTNFKGLPTREIKAWRCVRARFH